MINPWFHRYGPLLLLGLLLVGCRAAADDPPDSPASPPVAAAYVGDAACVACHAEIVETYRQTNKAKALSRFDPETAPERFDDAVVHNEAFRLSYEAFVRGDTLYQREFREDPTGRVVHERVHRADYVIGSGNATRSYLMQVEGYLTEMPLTWYVHRGQWDMSPGYREANDRFDRQINLLCITCHNGTGGHSAFTQNHYTNLPEGITCERCHGPASAHIDARQADPVTVEPLHATALRKPDPTIVNPAHLDRDARLSICQQCHLAGVIVFKTGEDPTTFRPGMMLAAHRTVFVPTGELTDEDAVGIDSHPVRLARSACYQNSEMTCGTCHDPHKPKALLAADQYNASCRTCHSDGAHAAGLCARPDAQSAQEAATGACTTCHMRQGGTTNVPHVIFTDHWIRRDPGPPRNPDEGRPAFDQPDPINLVALQEPGRPAHVIAPRTADAPLYDLEAAVAYLDFYETMHRVPAYIDSVIYYGRRGFARGADHVEARIALARALAEADSLAEAVTVLEAAAGAYPNDAWVHFWLGSMLEAQGTADAALNALEHALVLQPLLIEAQVKRADALVKAGRPAQALAQLETVVTLDPAHRPRAWFNKGIIHLQMQQPEAAAEAFAEAAHLDPDLVDAHIQLGSIQMTQQHYEAAVNSFQNAILADPSNPAGYGSLGVVYLQIGQQGAARRLFERVLQLDPTNENARALLRQLQ